MSNVCIWTVTVTVAMADWTVTVIVIVALATLDMKILSLTGFMFWMSCVRISHVERTGFPVVSGPANPHR